MGEHRVSALGATLRRYEDPAQSADPRIRELVAQLRALEPGPAPRAHFRAELRSQLVAVTPRLVAEGTATELRPTPSAAEADHATPLATRLRAAVSRLGHQPARRPLGIVVGVLTVFALLLGGAVWISNKALPGDALYALKRANENVQLSLTHGTDRARTYLSFASTRADEVKSLVSHASALAVAERPSAGSDFNAHTTKLIKSTLGSADDDVRSASQLIGSEAVSSRSAAPLEVMTTWAPGQIRKLQSITDSLPAGSLHDRAAQSTQLVKQALSRAVALRGLVKCSCLDSARTDQLGPVPCSVCTASDPVTSTTAPATTQPGTTSGGQRGTVHGTTAPGSGSRTAAVPAPNATGAVTVTPPGGIPTILPTLPSLPLPLPTTGPVVVDSCGVGASVGPIGIGIGSCGVHVTL